MLHHKIGPLKPEEATTPNFAQIYFVDEGVQIHFAVNFQIMSKKFYKSYKMH